MGWRVSRERGCRAVRGRRRSERATRASSGGDGRALWAAVRMACAEPAVTEAATRRAPLDGAERRRAPSAGGVGCESSSTERSRGAPGPVHPRPARRPHPRSPDPTPARPSRRCGPGRAAGGSGCFRSGGHAARVDPWRDRCGRTWHRHSRCARRIPRACASTAESRPRREAPRQCGSPSPGAGGAVRARTRRAPRAWWRATQPRTRRRWRAEVGGR